MSIQKGSSECADAWCEDVDSGNVMMLGINIFIQ